MNSENICRIFVIEDDPTYTKFLKYVYDLNPDYEVHFYETAKAALADLESKKPDIINLDFVLPDMLGEDVLKKIHEFDSEIPVIVVSGQEKIDTAVNLLKSGAYDYIVKDNEAKERILNSVQNARTKRGMIREMGRLKEEIAVKYEFEKSIVGSSEAIRKVFGLLDKAVKSNITVSIYGETGTGKELVAKAIHYNSKRKNKPFVAINVTAIPKELLEGELFGYEKGAFTGAIARRIGKFEEAHEGTIFLDEIGEMELAMQAKLLRVLQEREVTRLGSNEVISLDTRVMVATNKNLQEEVKAGRFREDLYYRLLGLPIHLPPLRDRGQDIIILAKYFLDQFVRENQLNPVRLSPEAQQKLNSYQFPGNVRELRSVMELAAVLCENGEIGENDISFNSNQSTNFFSSEMSLEDYTYYIIRNFLNKYDGNVLEVANKLGIGKSSIYRYLKEMEAKGI
ncbi:MAG: sigma-54-dependent Fis family transcriptional regulator [Bacteroidetes bacterium]|nr:sigma-54-dependent Fis family transcriptional regulator [Bacteroidota bacterium]